MTKDEIKSVIRHALLNIFTVLNITVNSTSVAKEDRNRAMDLIKIAALLVEYERIYLGQKMNFNSSEVNIKEVLNLLGEIYKKDFSRKKVIFSIDRNDFIIRCDKKRIQESLELIIKKLMFCSTVIDFKFNISSKKIIITHSCNQKEKLKKIIPIVSIQNQEYDNYQAGYQLALELLDKMGIKIIIGSKTIKLQF
ncbi:hypothetical protein JW758_04275 [Candidatus Peregrinibacteria bacterium]|nr:hypothetical protein [Candidatus Peregrinibacteria bacterium]